MHLWLNVLTLVQDWNKDHNVMYLMDSVIRAAFFHLESRAMTENMFQNLFCVSFSDLIIFYYIIHGILELANSKQLFCIKN